MMRLTTLIDEVRKDGYNEAYAEARVCQDIVLKAIDKSQFSQHITIKGGVVMRSITGDARRATQDMDLDFIRYSLEEDSIHRFIDRLNCLEGIQIEVAGKIEELSQQEYHGKRVNITISDDTGYVLRSKIDLGVHKQMQIEQDEYCFDVCMDDEGASLLINSKEQIFTEKLRSLLRFGPFSTRYKDVFDLCYLSQSLDTDRLMKCIDVYIFSDAGMRENDMTAIKKRVQNTFVNGTYRRQIERSRNTNWMDIPVQDAMSTIIDYLTKLMGFEQENKQ